MTNLTWLPDGKTLVAAYHGGRVYLCDGELRVVRELPRHDSLGGLAAVAWSDDGRVLSTAGDEPRSPSAPVDSPRHLGRIATKL